MKTRSLTSDDKALISPNTLDLNPVVCAMWGALPTACLPSSSHSRR